MSSFRDEMRTMYQELFDKACLDTSSFSKILSVLIRLRKALGEGGEKRIFLEDIGMDRNTLMALITRAQHLYDRSHALSSFDFGEFGMADEFGFQLFCNLFMSDLAKDVYSKSKH